jgi:hypothetical protein
MGKPREEYTQASEQLCFRSVRTWRGYLPPTWHQFLPRLCLASKIFLAVQAIQEKKPEHLSALPGLEGDFRLREQKIVGSGANLGAEDSMCAHASVNNRQV